MRLIVGADLRPDDVHAIIQGAHERLTSRLNERLEDVEKWPDDVTRGVQLLAWMVANDYLDVKVALRTHAETGEPIPYDSVEDGYVHEKWAVFEDPEGNRLYASGALNESRTALLLNAENLDVHCDWRGGFEKQRVDNADRSFGINWKNQNPALYVTDIPEAVRRKLIRFAEGLERPVEIDGNSAVPPKVEPPSAKERLLFAMIADGPKLPGGRFVGMATAPVEPWPHQYIVARRLIENWPCSFLLCDEVGLGKTIEAGLAIRSLYLSGLAKRILIAPPASLTHQWHREMASKFMLPFALTRRGTGTRHSYLLPLEEERPANAVYDPDLVIVSNALVARSEREMELRGAGNFDITLMDEAHYLRRGNPQKGATAWPRYGNLYRQVQNILRKKTKCLWLATATPMQLEPVEVYDLLRLTHRAGSFLDDPALLHSYYDTLNRVVQSATLKQHDWEFLRRSIKEVSHLDPLLWQFIEKAVMDTRTRVAARSWLERGTAPRGRDRNYIARLLFSVAPLSRVMLRHTRQLLEIYREKGELERNLATREILPVPRIVFDAQEQAAYDQLQEYCRELSQRMRENSEVDNRGTVAFWLSFLRLRFASSMYAIKQTISRRIDKVRATLDHLRNGWQAEEPDITEADLRNLLEGEDEEAEDAAGFLKNRSEEDLLWEQNHLQGMLDTLRDLSHTSPKMRQLLAVLESRRIDNTRRIRQTVVFTRFYDTLCDIRERLLNADRSIRIGTYSGHGGQFLDPDTCRMRWTGREAVKHLFMRGDIDILLCTDAAAEGLNLQTADYLVNYDLPWNPMKVEQRIGRIDRIGQANEKVYVLNLCYAGSAEQIVYDRLLRRLAQANTVVGMQQFSMLQVTCDEFEQLANGKIDESEIEQRARDRAGMMQERTRSREIPAEEKYKIYRQLANQYSDQPPPVDLEYIWQALTQSRYLKDLGCVLQKVNGEEFLELHNIPAVAEGSALTISRDAWENGVAEFEGRLHFATYGDPVFDALIKHFQSFELPESVRRVTVNLPEANAGQVGYAVVPQGNSSASPRLLISAKEVPRLDDSVNLAGSLTDTQVDTAQAELRKHAEREFAVVRKVPQIERFNHISGKFQLMLDYRILSSLMRDMQQFSDLDDNFWRAIQQIEERCSSRKDGMRIANLPAEELQNILISMPADPLFDIEIPHAGTSAAIKAPPLLLHSAIQSGCRLADSLHRRRANLSTDEMLDRLDREADKELAKLP